MSIICIMRGIFSEHHIYYEGHHILNRILNRFKNKVNIVGRVFNKSFQNSKSYCQVAQKSYCQKGFLFGKKYAPNF